MSSEDIFINPWFIPAPNRPYQNLTAEVGDTISFFWNESESVNTVFILPSRTCNLTSEADLQVGLSSPTVYQFTEADVDASPLFFASTTPTHCELGMNFLVDVVIPGSGGSDVPSDSPTEQPSGPNTTAPTQVPLVAESDAPSAAPSEGPVEPTESPTVESDAPSEAPTGSPTETPSAAPALAVVPTTSPSVGATDPPSSAPTRGSTTAPTTSKPVGTPTLKPSSSKPAVGSPTAQGGTTETLTGVRMGMAGISDLPDSTKETWSEFTASFSSSFVFAELGGVVENFVTTYEVTDVIPGNARKQRGLIRRDLQQQQQESVIVVYTQTMTYDTTDDTITPDILAAAPFATDDEKTAYVTLLGTSGDPVLEEVTGISDVTLATRPPTAAPSDSGGSDDDSSGGLSTAAIIGIACGGGAALIIAVLYFMYCRKTDSPAAVKRDEPPLHVSVNDDDISTLAGPAGPPTYGDQRYATFVS